MTSYPGFLGLWQQGLFLGAVIVVLTTLLTALCHAALKSRLQRFDAATRASLILGLCLAPLVIAASVLFAALLPSLLQLLGFANDHCLGHVDGHRHFCLIHRPTVLDSQPLSLLAALFAAGLLLVLGHLVLDLLRMRRFRQLLRSYRVTASGDRVRIVDTALPLALTTGYLRPVIVVSTGLLQTLTAEERELLLAHERAHLARRDGLRWLLARAFSLFQLPAVRRSMLEQLYLATEQACDESASRQSRAPERMAELLLKIERLYQRCFPLQIPLAPGVVGGKDNAVPARIRALLAPAVGIRLPQLGLLCLMLLLLLVLGSHTVLHDWLEHALELFQR